MEKIAVSIRVRPLNKQEVTKGCPWKLEANTVSLCNERGGPVIGQSFSFDNVFGTAVSTADIYNAQIKDIIASAVDGFNGTVFAYGQTSSGKTFTMRGAPDEPGIIPLAIQEVFSNIGRAVGREFLLRVSYMEIYNEEINDLLAPENRKLQVHESLERGIYVAGLREEIVVSPEQVLHLMESGEAHRHVGKTNMNEYSSRSHTIFRMVIESRDKSLDDPHNLQGPEQGVDAVLVSTLNLVDLAGSERAAKTGAEGARLKEGSHINKSLMTLGTVVNKLSEGTEKSGGHVPYRDSKLTRILQTALGGNAKTSIICNVTPALIHVDETRGTLLFASRAKRVTTCAQVNEIITDAALLKRQKREIEELRSKLQQTHSPHLEEEILGLRNQMLKIELERERIAVELQEERAAQAERERRMREAQQKIENLSHMVISAAVDDRDDGRRQKKGSRRETWCPRVMPSDLHPEAGSAGPGRPHPGMPPSRGQEGRWRALPPAFDELGEEGEGPDRSPTRMESRGLRLSSSPAGSPGGGLSEVAEEDEDVAGEPAEPGGVGEEENGDAMEDNNGVAHLASHQGEGGSCSSGEAAEGAPGAALEELKVLRAQHAELQEQYNALILEKDADTQRRRQELELVTAGTADAPLPPQRSDDGSSAAHRADQRSKSLGGCDSMQTLIELRAQVHALVTEKSFMQRELDELTEIAKEQYAGRQEVEVLRQELKETKEGRALSEEALRAIVAQLAATKLDEQGPSIEASGFPRNVELGGGANDTFSQEGAEEVPPHGPNSAEDRAAGHLGGAAWSQVAASVARLREQKEALEAENAALKRAAPLAGQQADGRELKGCDEDTWQRESEGARGRLVVGVESEGGLPQVEPTAALVHHLQQELADVRAALAAKEMEPTRRASAAFAPASRPEEAAQEAPEGGGESSDGGSSHDSRTGDASMGCDVQEPEMSLRAKVASVEAELGARMQELEELKERAASWQQEKACLELRLQVAAKEPPSNLAPPKISDAIGKATGGEQDTGAAPAAELDASEAAPPGPSRDASGLEGGAGQAAPAASPQVNLEQKRVDALQTESAEVRYQEASELDARSCLMERLETVTAELAGAREANCQVAEQPSSAGGRDLTEGGESNGPDEEVRDQLAGQLSLARRELAECQEEKQVLSREVEERRAQLGAAREEARRLEAGAEAKWSELSAAEAKGAGLAEGLERAAADVLEARAQLAARGEEHAAALAELGAVCRAHEEQARREASEAGLLARQLAEALAASEAAEAESARALAEREALCDEVTRELCSLEAQQVALRKKVEDLESQLAAEHSTASEASHKLESSRQQHLHEVGQLRAELAGLRKDSGSAKALPAVLEKERDVALKEVERGRQKLREAEARLKSAAQEKSTMQAERANMERELKNLRGQSSLLTRDINRRESVADRQRESIAAGLSKTRVQLLTAEQQLQARSLELEKALFDLHILQTAHEQLEGTCRELEGGRAALEQRVCELEALLRDASAAQSTADAKAEDAEAGLAAAASGLHEASRALEALRSDHDALLSRLYAKETAIEDAAAELAAYGQLKAEHAQLEGELRGARELASTLKRQLEAAQGRHAGEVSRVSAEHCVQVAALEKGLQGAQQQVQSLRDQLAVSEASAELAQKASEEEAAKLRTAKEHLNEMLQHGMAQLLSAQKTSKGLQEANERLLKSQAAAEAARAAAAQRLEACQAALCEADVRLAESLEGFEREREGVQLARARVSQLEARCADLATRPGRPEGSPPRRGCEPEEEEGTHDNRVQLQRLEAQKASLEGQVAELAAQLAAGPQGGAPAHLQSRVDALRREVKDLKLRHHNLEHRHQELRRLVEAGGGQVAAFDQHDALKDLEYRVDLGVYKQERLCANIRALEGTIGQLKAERERLRTQVRTKEPGSFLVSGSFSHPGPATARREASKLADRPDDSPSPSSWPAPAQQQAQPPAQQLAAQLPTRLDRSPLQALHNLAAPAPPSMLSEYKPNSKGLSSEQGSGLTERLQGRGASLAADQFLTRGSSEAPSSVGQRSRLKQAPAEGPLADGGSGETWQGAASSGSPFPLNKENVRT